MPPIRKLLFTLITLSIILVVFLVPINKSHAAQPLQDVDPPPPEHTSDQDCKECHLDVADSWSHSPHAHAYDDPVFQDRWNGMGEPGECLLCHTTNYQSTSGDFTAPGVDCEIARSALIVCGVT